MSLSYPTPLLAMALLTLAAACSPSHDARSCASSQDCFSDETCIQSRCHPTTPDDAGHDADTEDAGPPADTGHDADTNPPTDAGHDADADTGPQPSDPSLIARYTTLEQTPFLRAEAIAFDTAHHPHLAFVSRNNQTIQLVSWTGDTWESRVLNAPDNSFSNSAPPNVTLRIRDDIFHLVYHDEHEGTPQVTYARGAGSENWSYSPLPVPPRLIPGYLTMDLAPNGFPVMGFPNEVRARIDENWHIFLNFENADPPLMFPGPLASSPSSLGLLALRPPADNPTIANALWLAELTNDNEPFQLTPIADNSSPSFLLRYSPNGTPLILYHQFSNAEQRLVRRNERAMESVFIPVEVHITDLAYTPSGLLYILGHATDATGQPTGQLTLHRQTSNGGYEPIDLPEIPAHNQAILRITPDNHAHIFYRTDTAELRHLRLPLFQ
ncbi:hypothetical protein DL240_15615 [Lujinxingia litoralis]|uniref:Uncharacterized protein n=1 Tax=Lujinxingia litoralis TaxID=2211119 RepID=A0A328C6X5_9DELT|nr:hypothetical protein [Lujinxingia litoralis]RAL20744.1 hypothetical protein DL240_15615 [Lujinxingia litoralis]